MKAIVILATMGLLSAGAYEQAPNAILKLTKAPHGILQADTNKDGAVSRSEYLAMNIARFDRMDSNHDGHLTLDERATERAPNGLPPVNRTAPPQPGGVDADGDGLVSMPEYFLNLGIIFSHFDANGDDRIAGDEIAPVAAPSPR